MNEMEYTVRLSSFEGPLDLLLFLIRKNELDIYDIPISVVVGQYIEYLTQIDELSIDLAGEYLLMLATMMRIKSRMLLPGEEVDDDETGEDPRAELVQKLLEYQKFKEIAGDLQEKEKIRSLAYHRGTDIIPAEGFEPDAPELDLELDSLLTAFRQAMQRFSDIEDFVIEKLQFTVEDKMNFITDSLKASETIQLEELLATCKSKIELIVLFLALLELMRLRKLKVRQRGTFGKLAIQKLPDEAGEPDMVEEVNQ
jgi:segregation and condensation protein A